MARGKGNDHVVARNRRAHRDYGIEERFEAGIALVGTEVKSLRGGQASINEAYAREEGGELYLVNAHIPEYTPASRFNHDPRRRRKLLLHKRQIKRLAGAVTRRGMTLVPLAIYFNASGVAKVELALARGREKADRRDAVKERDWRRQQARLLRDQG